MSITGLGTSLMCYSDSKIR